jgi:predicted transposase YbfD/YdcC
MVKLVDVGSIASYFESLSDPRHTRNRKHRLVDITVPSVCAILCGCGGPTAMHRWATERQEWLAQHLPLANGIPSRDCIRRLLMMLRPEAFRRRFRHRIAHALPSDEKAPHRLVAIDGKTCRGSRDAANHLGPPHLVSAWAGEEGIALGQVATDAKSNEITAIPLLLEQIALPKTIVTIDAMGCQKDVVAQIVKGQGTAVLAVKDNQPKPHAAIEAFFAERIEHDFDDVRYRVHETHDQGHGRIDERSYYLAKLPRDFAPAAEWPRVKAIGYAMRRTKHADGRETGEVRYYIGTRYLSGKRFAEAVRGHWSIESMHWVPDVTFREDDSRTRERTLGNNPGWLRRFAITLLKRHPADDGIKGKMRRRSYNTAFRTEVLTMNQV